MSRSAHGRVVTTKLKAIWLSRDAQVSANPRIPTIGCVQSEESETGVEQTLRPTEPLSSQSASPDF